jgi:serine protease AprX
MPVQEPEMSMPRIVASTVFIGFLALCCTRSEGDSEVRVNYIVQASDVSAAHDALAGVEAAPGRDLPIIRATTASLTRSQAARLRRDGSIRLYADLEVRTSGFLPTSLDQLIKDFTNRTNMVLAQSAVGGLTSTTAYTAAPVLGISLLRTVTTPVAGTLSSGATLRDGRGVSALALTYETNYPGLIGADQLHDRGITGASVTIAVLDSGLWQDTAQNYGGRIRATVDVVNGGRGAVNGDPYGHGTHITSIAASGAITLTGRYHGIAPRADLVIVRAFDRFGAGRYTDVIAGLDWVVRNRDRHNIRVLNLSFGAQPQSFYWDDPLNQAVMAAWRAGIVVVVSSGNDGPAPMTVNVPGNVPYVITVGAMTDSYTPSDATDDVLATFSSSGPTYEGFVKPEIVAPGGHIAASMSSSTYLATLDPDSMQLGQQLFTMSGTSQASAVTTGVVALLLNREPWLTPDEVKCRLIRTARPAVTGNNRLAYSVFQQGAGLINAASAAGARGSDTCANIGLDIHADLAGLRHFGGPANRDANGNFYIMEMGDQWGAASGNDGETWDTSYGDDGYRWSAGYNWSEGYAWGRGYPWTKGSAVRTKSVSWSEGYTWNRGIEWWRAPPRTPAATSPASIANWVPNE